MHNIFFINDIIFEITKYLDFYSILNLTRTNKYLTNIIRYEIIWKNHNLLLNLPKPDWAISNFYLTKMARSKISISMKRLHIAKEISYYKEKKSRLFSENVASKKKFFLGHGKYFFDIGLFDWSEFLFSQLYLYNPYDIEYLDYLAGQITDAHLKVPFLHFPVPFPI